MKRRSKQTGRRRKCGTIRGGGKSGHSFLRPNGNGRSKSKRRTLPTAVSNVPAVVSQQDEEWLALRKQWEDSYFEREYQRRLSQEHARFWFGTIPKELTEKQLQERDRIEFENFVNSKRPYLEQFP